MLMDKGADPDAVDKELVTSIEANYALGRAWELEGKVAARWVRNDFNALTASAASFMYQCQLIRIIAECWDVGLTARVVHQKETGTVRYGGAFEVGRLMAENLWLGAGYSYGGHEDQTAPVNEFTSNGFYVRLRYKFNERLLRYFY